MVSKKPTIRWVLLGLVAALVVYLVVRSMKTKETYWDTLDHTPYSPNSPVAIKGQRDIILEWAAGQARDFLENTRNVDGQGVQILIHKNTVVNGKTGVDVVVRNTITTKYPTRRNIFVGRMTSLLNKYLDREIKRAFVTLPRTKVYVSYATEAGKRTPMKRISLKTYDSEA